MVLLHGSDIAESEVLQPEIAENHIASPPIEEVAPDCEIPEVTASEPLVEDTSKALESIRVQDRACQEAKAVWLAAKSRVKFAREEVKEAHEAYITQVTTLHEMIQGSGDLTDSLSLQTSTTAYQAEEVLRFPSSGEWRCEPIEVLTNLKPSLLDKLKSAGVENLGHIDDLRVGAGLSSIKGIGKSKAEQIEDSLADWLSNLDDDGDDDGDGEDDSDLEDEVDAPFDGDDSASPQEELPQEGPPDVISGTAKNIVEKIRASGVEKEFIQVRARDLSKESYAVLRHSDAWQAGVVARSQSKGVEFCPENDLERLDDWIRGWLAQDSQMI